MSAGALGGYVHAYGKVIDKMIYFISIPQCTEHLLMHS